MKTKEKKKINRDFMARINFMPINVKGLTGKFIVLKNKLHPKQNYKKITAFIQKKPYTSFIAVLIIFLGLMVIGNLLFSTKPVTEQDASKPKKVSVFKLGLAPTVSYQGKVEKSGVIKIVAQTPGIVSSINAYVGQQANAGTNILSLSTNYQGGNTLSIARQIAQKQYQNSKDTYSISEDIIGRQKDLANKNHDNTLLLQQIANQSASDTKALADLNKTIVDSLISQIQADEAGGATPETILSKKQVLSQYQSALVGVNASLRNLQLQSNSDNPSTVIANQQHEVAVRQLELQRKALDLTLDLSKLSYDMALISEASMYPVTPFAGTVERIFVKVGESVTPGTTLATLSGNNQHVEIIVNVPENIAKNISVFEPSSLYIGGKFIKMMPSYVSKDATDGALYSVIYQLDNSFTNILTDADFIEVNIPIGTANTTNEIPFIPLDAIIQTQEAAFVYVVEKGTAKSKKIVLGQIQGEYAEVVSGLLENAQVILNRNVIEGDKVTVVR